MNREDLFQVVYVGPGQVYLMIFGETPQLRSHHEDFAHIENDRVNME